MRRRILLFVATCSLGACSLTSLDGFTGGAIAPDPGSDAGLDAEVPLAVYDKALPAATIQRHLSIALRQ